MTTWELGTDARTHASCASPSRYKTADFLVDPVLIASCLLPLGTLCTVQQQIAPPVFSADCSVMWNRVTAHAALFVLQASLGISLTVAPPYWTICVAGQCPISITQTPFGRAERVCGCALLTAALRPMIVSAASKILGNSFEKEKSWGLRAIRLHVL
ncbi:hypothetical protein J3F84DRAFT_356021 [Trichoderma pleuroticola]